LKYIDPNGHGDENTIRAGGDDEGEGQPPTPEEILMEILHSMLDVIHDPTRTEPIQITLDDGTVLVIMPVNSSPGSPESDGRSTASTILSYVGIWLDLAELMAILIPIEGFTGDVGLSVGDLLVTVGSCYYGGQCYLSGQPHPSLPEMAVVNQDVLVTAADLGIPIGIGLTVGGLTGNPATGAASELVVDVGTTLFSFALYDPNRLSGDWRNHISVGIGEGKEWILFYP
jgi:hypothetical protein